jgi:hypothetical protein
MSRWIRTEQHRLRRADCAISIGRKPALGDDGPLAQHRGRQHGASEPDASSALRVLRAADLRALHSHRAELP